MKNPIYAGTKDFDINVAEFKKPQSMQRQHYHDTYEIYLVLEGKKNLFLDDKKYMLRKGSLFVVEPFVLHMTTCADSVYCKRYIMNLSPKALSPMLTNEEIEYLFKRFSTCVLDLNEDKLHIVFNYFAEIHRYKNIKNSLANKLMRMTIAHLVDFICREQSGQVAITLKNPTKKSEAPVMQALLYINMNYTKNISLDFISEYANMSKSNFCLAFKKAVGDSFINYLNTVRISQVHKLLLTTSLSLTEIAARTGFASVDYLTRTFKKIHGISPSQMRKNSKISSEQ
ncbi:MAG: helix-turn-helix domain-containing protein [Clostridia bacterium]